MKTKTLGLFAIPVIAAIMIGTVGSMTSVRAEPATVGKDIGCGLFDGTGAIVYTDDSQYVITNNGKNTSKLTCHLENVANTTGKAVHFDFESTDILCTIPGVGAVETWKAVVSDNGDGTGDATLVCWSK